MRTLRHALTAAFAPVIALSTIVAMTEVARAQGSPEPPPAEPEAPSAPPAVTPPGPPGSAPAAPGYAPGAQPPYPPGAQVPPGQAPPGQAPPGQAPPGSQPPPPGWGQPPPGYGQPYPPPGYGQPAYPPYYYPYYYPPPGPAQPPGPKKERNSPAAMVIGITMMSVGVVGLVAGGAVFGSAADAVDVYCDPGPQGGGIPFQCDRRDHEGRQVAGVVLMVTGGVVAAAGIPILVVGARKVPARDNDATPTPSQPEAPPPAPTAATFSLSVNPSGAVLGGSF